MIRSKASGLLLLADYKSEVEENCSPFWRTVLLEANNAGALREATYIQNIKQSHSVGGQALGGFNKAE